MRREVHRTIDDVTRDLERWSYNTAVAHCMELRNLLQRYARGSEGADGEGADGDGPVRGTAPTPTCGTRRSAHSSACSRPSRPT